MAGIDLYQSDVRGMPDVELEKLSEELSEAYEQSGGDDGYWTDDAAETRYYEMRAEIARRWDLAHPEEAARRRPMTAMFVRVALGALQGNLQTATAISREVDRTKVGDTITVRRPAKFTEPA